MIPEEKHRELGITLSNLNVDLIKELGNLTELERNKKTESRALRCLNRLMFYLDDISFRDFKLKEQLYYGKQDRKADQ